MRRPKKDCPGYEECESYVQSLLKIKKRTIASTNAARVVQYNKRLTGFLGVVTMFQFSRSKNHRVPIQLVVSLLIEHEACNITERGRYIFDLLFQVKINSDDHSFINSNK